MIEYLMLNNKFIEFFSFHQSTIIILTSGSRISLPKIYFLDLVDWLQDSECSCKYSSLSFVFHSTNFPSVPEESHKAIPPAACLKRGETGIYKIDIISLYQIFPKTQNKAEKLSFKIDQTLLNVTRGEVLLHTTENFSFLKTFKSI